MWRIADEHCEVIICTMILTGQNQAISVNGSVAFLLKWIDREVSG